MSNEFEEIVLKKLNTLETEIKNINQIIFNTISINSEKNNLLEQNVTSLKSKIFDHNTRISILEHYNQKNIINNIV